MARLYELANATAEAERAGPGRAWLGPARSGEVLARLIAPMMPHLAEEMQHSCTRRGTAGRRSALARSRPGSVAADTVTLAVQVMASCGAPWRCRPARTRRPPRPGRSRTQRGSAAGRQAGGPAHPRAGPDHQHRRGRGLMRSHAGRRCWGQAHSVAQWAAAASTRSMRRWAGAAWRAPSWRRSAWR